MENTNVFDWNKESEIIETSYIKFPEKGGEGAVIVIFQGNDPVKGTDKFGKDNYTFAATNEEGHPAYFATGSKRCLQALMNYLPLDMKKIVIYRKGSGYETDYSAEEAKE